MSEMKYDGKSGWGVIPEYRRTDRPPRTVQKTLVSRHDSMPPEVETIHVPPVAIEMKKKPRDPNEPFALDQERFDFIKAAPDSYEVLESPIPGFRNRRLYSVEASPEEVSLEGGVTLKIPRSFDELQAVHNLDLVNTELLFFMEEQVRGVMLAHELLEHNLFFEADTSFGKTVMELMIAAIEIQKTGGNVVLITPTIDLVDQIANEANLFFKFPEGMVAKLSGQVPAKDRKAIYDNPEVKLIITTPDILEHDLKNGLTTPSRFTMGEFDEGDKGVGNTGYNSAGRILAEGGVKIRAFSATLPDKDYRMHEMLDAFKIELHNIIKLHSPSQKIITKTVFRKITEPEMIEAAGDLYNSVARCAEELERSLSEVGKTDDGELPEVSILADFRKITKLNKGKFDIPSNSETTRIINALGAGNKSDQKRFGLCFSQIAEFGYRAHLFNTLVRFGKVAFLKTIAAELWSKKYYTPRKKGKKRGLYFDRVFSDPDLIQVYQKVSAGKFFGKLADPRTSLGGLVKELGAETWEQRKLKLAQANADKNKTYLPEWWTKQRLKHAIEIRELFIKKASEEIAQDQDWYDGPGLAFAKDVVRMHCTFGRAEQVITTTDSAENALFFPIVLDTLVSGLGKVAVPYAGMIHMPLEDRKNNLELFKQGKAEVLVGTTKAVELGLNSNAIVMLCLNIEVTVAGQRQIRGRIARKGQIGFMYQCVTLGTVDFPRLYAGHYRLRDDERRN